MPRRLIPVAVALALLVVGAVFWLRSDHGAVHFTGFVEGEERVLRSEVSARVLEVRFVEGDPIPPDSVIVRLDDAEIRARMETKEREIATADAEVSRGEAQLALVEQTWTKDVAAREAELRQAAAGADLARRTLDRTQNLKRGNVASEQSLDEAKSRHVETRSGVDRARDMLARAQAEEGQIAVNRSELEVLRHRRALAAAQLEELRVIAARYEIRSPKVGTVLQTQLVWPGELAQPGTPVASVLDPEDKYVQIYVPVADVAHVRVGQPMEIELDSEPGARIPGEVSFVADSATFTPEKIETRSDRMGQVYRAKVRILKDAQRLQPGTEGNVYVAGKDRGRESLAAREGR